MPVYRLIEEGLVPGKNFIQVGLRGYYPDERRGFKAVMDDVVAEVKDGPEYLYISFDIDTLDPSFVPATGTPEPDGSRRVRRSPSCGGSARSPMSSASSWWSSLPCSIPPTCRRCTPTAS